MAVVGGDAHQAARRVSLPERSGTIMTPTRLPAARSSDGPRSDAGTDAWRTSPGVSSPRASSRLRAPPATAVSTTSFTVPPWAWATFLIRSRSARTSMRWWCPLTGTLMDTRGARRARASALADRASGRSRARMAARMPHLGRGTTGGKDLPAQAVSQEFPCARFRSWPPGGDIRDRAPRDRLRKALPSWLRRRDRRPPHGEAG